MQGKNNHVAALTLQGFDSEDPICMHTCVHIQKIDGGRIGEAEAH